MQRGHNRGQTITTMKSRAMNLQQEGDELFEDIGNPSTYKSHEISRVSKKLEYKK